MHQTRAEKIAAEHEKARQAREAAAEAKRTKENARRERDLKRAYVAAGGTETEFEAVKGDLIEKDKKEAAVRNKGAARAAQAALYRRF